MGYCTQTVMRTLMPKTITIGTGSTTGQNLQRPSTASGVHFITPADAETFIDLATQQIDAKLSTLYLVPLKRIKSVDVDLLSNARSGASTLRVADAGRFNRGGLVRISDTSSTETNQVAASTATATDLTLVNLLNPLGNTYRVSWSARISLIEYPDPIPDVCARIAVSMVMDRQFISEQDTDVSNYGKTQRSTANTMLDQILSGVIRLNGQPHVGRRFARNSLRDSVETSSTDFQQGAAKET